MCKKEELLSVFPEYLKQRFTAAAEDADNLNEIRMGVNCPVRLIRNGRECFLSEKGNYVNHKEKAWVIGETDIDAIVKHVCAYSLYAFENEIRQGFLTIQGGHRIGLAGRVVLNEDQSIRNLSHIRYLNIRVSHEIQGVADGLFPYLLKEGRVCSTLIVSPPGCGKTTLLRDLVRQASDGNELFTGTQVAVVDERSEIAGCYLGIPQNTVGMRTDILDACPKEVGMMLLMRSMAPGIVAVDELSGERELNAVRQILSCGTGILATMHGYCMEDVRDKSFELPELFERFVFLRRTASGGYCRTVCQKDGAVLYREQGE